MDQPTHHRSQSLIRELPVLLALACAAILPGLLGRHSEPSFSPEDYVYTALAGDLRTSLAFLLDWRQQNYRPLSHGLVYLFMSPFYGTFGAIAYAWLLSLLKAAVAGAFYLSLRAGGLSRIGGAFGAGLLLASGGWLSLHLWNALAINVYLFQAGLCLLLASFPSSRPRPLLFAATFVASASYSVGALFPFAFLAARRISGRAADWRSFGWALLAGACGWVSLVNGVIRKLTVLDEAKPLSSGLSYHPMHLHFEPGRVLGRLAESLSFRLGEFLPPLRALAEPSALGAVVLVLLCALALWLARRETRLWRLAFTLGLFVLLFSAPFLFIRPPYSLRFNWPSDLVFCAFAAVLTEALLSRARAAQAVLAAAWIGTLLLWPSARLTGLAAGMKENRQISERLKSVALPPSRQGELVCLPTLADDFRLPDRPNFPDGMKRAFYEESLRGIVLLSELKAHGSLERVLDRSSLQARCQVAVNF